MLEQPNPLPDDQDPTLLLEKFQLQHAVTPQEKLFFQNKSPSPEDITNFKKHFECFCFMLWALGYIEPLYMPIPESKELQQSRVLRARAILVELTKEDKGRFRKFAKLRSPAEILDKADLMYRLVWAGVDANAKKQALPRYLDLDIAWQWHYTIHWLIRKNNQDWDAVTPDS